MVARTLASVVFPTRNRAAILRESLAALRAQRGADFEWEIIAVDDASTDQTPELLEREAGAAHRVPLRVIRNPRRGPAAARNEGLREARGEVVLMSGDDILVNPDWVARHVAIHREVGKHVAVLGRTDWDPRMVRTYLMDYLDRGSQFGYDRIEDRENAGHPFFYASNLSLKRSFLLDADEWFDETYPYAAMEDIDLGYRLECRGLRIRYEPALLAHHHHPVSWRAFLERAQRVGRSTAIFHRKFPELGGRRPLDRPRHHPLKRWSCRALRPAAEALHWRAAADRCYRVCFDEERARGYRSG